MPWLLAMTYTLSDPIAEYTSNCNVQHAYHTTLCYVMFPNFFILPILFLFKRFFWTAGLLRGRGMNVKLVRSQPHGELMQWGHFSKWDCLLGTCAALMYCMAACLLLAYSKKWVQEFALDKEASTVAVNNEQLTVSRESPAARRSLYGTREHQLQNNVRVPFGFCPSFSSW